MNFNDANHLLKELPVINDAKAKVIYDFIRRIKPDHILELGFFHGKSTCYMAAALEENGGGVITTIDSRQAKNLSPNIQNVLAKARLEKYVNIIYSDISYNWELMKIIQDHSDKPHSCDSIFDLCFIDGAHTWNTDGLAFFLTEKLLRPGGWIIFDDVDWSYSKSPSLRNSPFVKKLPDEYRDTQQVQNVFTFLVQQHPSFTDFKVSREARGTALGWARKKDGHESAISKKDEIDKKRKRLFKPLYTNTKLFIKRRILYSTEQNEPISCNPAENISAIALLTDKNFENERQLLAFHPADALPPGERNAKDLQNKFLRTL